MIEKMTKYSFIMLSSYTEDFLQKLQEIGMMDITRSRKPVDEASAALLDRMKDCKDTAAYLKKADWAKDPDAKNIEKAAASAVLPETDPVAYVKEQKDRLEDLRNSISAAKARIRDYTPWGEFNRASLDRISDAGYELHYFSAPVKTYKAEWGQEYPIEEISRDGKNVWFVAITPKNGTVSLPAKEIQAPACSAGEEMSHMKEFEAETVSVKGNILKAKTFIGRLEAEYKETADKLDLYLADAASSQAAENTVTLLVGFAPSRDDEKVSAELDKLDAYWFKEEATKEDNPPIKLRNNRFTRQFEVLTGMYGMPVYDEFDPTPILAPFFLLFFSLCLPLIAVYLIGTFPIFTRERYLGIAVAFIYVLTILNYPLNTLINQVVKSSTVSYAVPGIVFLLYSCLFRRIQSKGSSTEVIDKYIENPLCTVY